MTKKTVLLVSLLLTLICAGTLAADPAPEMKKLAFMVGDWKGEGSMQRGPQPQTSLVDETIRAAAGGNAIVIDGVGRRKVEDGKAGDVVHDAHGLIFWDAEQKKYRFIAVTSATGAADADFELTGERTARWGFSTGQGRIRYTIEVTDKDEWIETGEFSRDGAQWMKFFQMKLQKVK
jgi:hypothetical protein